MKLHFSLEELVETHEKPGLFVLLDGITDTRNMGAIIRSAAAANATAVVIPTTGSAQITGETIKTSAGGLFQVPICRVSHLKDALYLLQSYDIQSIVADEKAAQNLFEFDLTNTVAIVMGAEDKGFHKELGNFVHRLQNSQSLGIWIHTMCQWLQGCFSMKQCASD
ncbi:MAG: hypothetical protein CM15mP59_3880 [Flavobacteriaceae bacterium]|nr:MAG: hypothetical protein CM15mP59_3880 [Flavobacteriaceae bacterium]